jgi:beta-lactamase regulating signal transducer with metallopeptidase domain
VWLTAFGTLLVLPLATLVVPSRVVVERDTQAVTGTDPLPVMVMPAADAAAAETPSVSAFPEITLDEIAIAIFALWATGVCIAGSRLMIGAFGLHLLRRQSRPHALAAADHPQIVMRRRECELRLSASQEGPMTWGSFRPVILLPERARAWTRERLQAVLLHELAHVRRRDSLTQSLSLLICAFYWPNPLVWLGARALRREAEIAADDAVLSSGMRPSAYAGELLQLASEFRGHGLAVSGVSMAGRSSLEARVKSVLAPNKLRKGVTFMDALKLACLGVAATAALAFARPDVVDAQNATAQTEPTVTSAPLPPPAPVAPTPAEVPPAVEASTPVEPETPATPATPPARHVHIRIVHTKHIKGQDGDDARMDQAQIDAAMEQARQAEAELQKVEPDIEKAIDAAKIDETVARAMADVEPRVRAEIARAMAKAKPAIRQAIADAHISEKVAKALKDAQPKIEAAIAKAREAQRHVRIEVESHDEGSSDQGMDDEKDDQRDEQ